MKWIIVLLGLLIIALLAWPALAADTGLRSALKELVESGSLKYSWLTHSLNAG